MLPLYAQVSAPPLAQPPSEKRVALVIGNAAYRESPLKNPVNDARAMATALRDLGFEVIQRENATKQQMERAVAEFGQALKPGAVALFYYAGHGMQLGGRNFLIPTDADIESEHLVRLQTLDLDLVLDQVAARGSDVNLMIIDACRNNPFERRFRARSGGLAQIDAPKGTLIAYATAPGKVASDGTGENGLYTEKLIEAIKTPALTVEDVFKRVRAQVAHESADAQTPWESSSLVGQFYFNAPATIMVQPPAGIDATHWQLVKDAADPVIVQSYLNKFPNGAYAVLARSRIEELRRPMALAQFDGAWAGNYKCEATAEGRLAGWTERDRVLTIKSGRIAGAARWRRNPDGATGTVSYTGTVDSNGLLTIVGTGARDGESAVYRIFHRGQIVDGRLTAEGVNGGHACTLDYRKLPFEAAAESMPGPAGPAAALNSGAPGGGASAAGGAFDGTWQGMYRCSATADGKAPANANAGRQLAIKDGRIDSETRWQTGDLRGYDTIAGLIGDDGSVIIAGQGRVDSGRTYRIHFQGRISAGLLSVSGRNASRTCTMDMVRVSTARMTPSQ